MESSKLVAIENNFANELKELQSIRDKVTEVRSKHDPALITREIGFLSNATKCSDLNAETRDLLFKEIRRKKLIREILEQVE